MKGGGYGLLWDIIFGLSGSFVGSWIFQTLGAPEAGWGGTGIAGGPHDHAPAQDLARAGRARLGTDPHTPRLGVAPVWWRVNC